MEDATTAIAIEKLRDLQVNYTQLIKRAKKHGIEWLERDDFECLERDLGFLDRFQRNTVKRRTSYGDVFNEIKRDIGDVFYEVEEIIDAFVSKGVQKRFLWRHRKNAVNNLHVLSRQFEQISHKVNHIREEILRNRVNISSDDYAGGYEIRPPRKKNMVGFADVTNALIRRLIQETNYFDVIPVIGMFGSGKTSVVWKIFNDPNIVDKFPIRIWLTISQRFSAREIIFRILKELTTINDYDIVYSKSEVELAYLVADYLKTKKFLIVMDDVWNSHDWDRLQQALPNDNTKGKVLITSRSKEVGSYASGERPPYNLRLFKFEESWELLRLEAFEKLDCPSDLEVIGREIAKLCDGLPLAIAVIGSALLRKFSSDLYKISRTIFEIESLYASSVLTEISEMDPEDRIKKSIHLSYDILPYNAIQCFLYLWLFPKGYKIQVSKLICMWIAEGFVQPHSSHSLEETAESYLEDLINRNLVQSCNVGRVKRCWVYSIIYDLLQTEAADEIFLQEIKGRSNEGPTPSMDEIIGRRIYLNSNCLDFISSRPPTAPRVRSFVCFSSDNYVGCPENKIFGFFKLLRVLDVQQPFKFTKIDSDIYNLNHLRYLALSSVLAVLPSKFNQLWNIQTLIIDTTSPMLKVEADIWKMKQLRHFKTNASATLPELTESGKYGSELQTLGYISVESCMEELFQRASSLKNLGIRGKLGLLFEGRSGSLECLKKISLQKLKLINDAYPKPQRGEIVQFPRRDQFPSGLTSLTLSGTFLSWKHMSTLGSLEKLEVLKLKDNAFSGRIFKAVGAAFERLLLLHIEDTDLVVWKASADHFPSLKNLVLKSCERLRGIPVELAEIPSLQNLELYHCISAAESAKEISEAKKRTLPAFVLSIYPPID